MDLSVIIVNYNTCQVTRECLDSIFRFTEGIDFEVIVVDNASADGSQEMLASYPGIIYIQSGSNLGFGRANNLGYKKASGRYILLLNSDTYLLNNALKCFVDEFDKQPNNVGCLGAKLLKPDGSPNHSYQELPTLKRDFKDMIEIYSLRLGLRFRAFNERDFDSLETFPVEYITGADLCVKNNVIEECGFFDPDFFMYYEETEMQYRFLRKGYKSMIVSTPKIVHLEGVSSKRKSFANRKMYISSRIIFQKKVYSNLQYVIARIIGIFSIPSFFATYYSPKETLKMIGLVFKTYRYIIK